MKIASFKKNAIVNILGWLLPTIIFLALTPLMIEKLGVEGFGVVTLIQVITGYMAVLNFGFSEAIIKHVAENRENDADRAMRVMWAGIGLFSAIGFIGAATIYSLADWLGYQVLQVPVELQHDTVTALKIGAIIFLLQMFAEYFRGTAIGCNRFDVPNISRIIRISLSGLLMAWVLNTGGGIADVMLATLVGLVVGLFINISWMQRVMPMTWLQGGYGEIYAELFHFSKHIFLVRVAGMVSGKISQFFLGTLSSVANVAWYEVPTRVAQTGAVFLNRIMQVFYPGFSSMDKVKDKDKIKSISYSVFSIQLLITVPVLIMVILEGESLLAVWIDNEFASKASDIITLVAITYFITSFTNLPTYTAMSFGFPEIISKYSLIRLLITVIIVYPFVKYYGLIGAAWVLLLSETPAIPFILEIYKKIFSENIYYIYVRQIVIHSLTGFGLFLVYKYMYMGSGYYSPLGVLAIGLLYPVIVLPLRVTSNEDNRRLMRMVTAWR